MVAADPRGEEVIKANQNLFFQVYWSGDKDRIGYRLERARRAGAKALIVTLDWSFSSGRDWGQPAIPEKMDLSAMVRLAPEGLRRPAVSVSNHGWNNLDRSPPSIRALPSIAAAVGNQIEVLFDGGIHRGGDVVIALALGARAVLLGRAHLWGLAARRRARREQRDRGGPRRDGLHAASARPLLDQRPLPR
jgi:isopentenyl diphosphate isomerase/L-lactate dehydrogenase-like FMN-dependent dehydrogenase